MAYEFKKLKDVAVAETVTDKANVLIEENGVIKKAPKNAIGGAGNGEWDAVIEIVAGSSGYFNSMELVSGDYQTLRNKIAAYEFPNLLVKYNDTFNYNREGITRVIGAYIRTDGDDEWINISLYSPNDVCKVLSIFADGTINQ